MALAQQVEISTEIENISGELVTRLDAIEHLINVTNTEASNDLIRKALRILDVGDDELAEVGFLPEDDE